MKGNCDLILLLRIGENQMGKKVLFFFCSAVLHVSKNFIFEKQQYILFFLPLVLEFIYLFFKSSNVSSIVAQSSVLLFGATTRNLLKWFCGFKFWLLKQHLIDISPIHNMYVYWCMNDVISPLLDLLYFY